MTSPIDNQTQGRLRYKPVWQGVGWVMVAAVVWLSLIPSPPKPPVFLGWDKAQHFIAYAGLMYWYAMSFSRHWRWPASITALGVGLEILQGLGGTRHFDGYDIAANCLGIAAGFLLARTRVGKLVWALDHFLARGLGSRSAKE